MRSRGEASQERLAQEEREKTALGALYMSVAQIPDSPAEPPVIIPDDQVDSAVRHMITGPDVDSIFWSGPPPSEASAAAFHNDQYSGPSGMGMGQEDQNKPFPQMDPNMLSAMSAGLGNMTPEQLTQLLATLASQDGMYGQQQQQPGGHDQQVPPYGNMGDGAGQQDWSHQQWGNYSGYQQEDGGDMHQQQQHQQQPPQRGGWDRGGFRGRGRGRGRGGPMGDGYKDSRKRKPCTFFAQGRRVHPIVPFLFGDEIFNRTHFSHRCRYGDQCDFSHDAY